MNVFHSPKRNNKNSAGKRNFCDSQPVKCLTIDVYTCYLPRAFKLRTIVNRVPSDLGAHTHTGNEYVGGESSASAG